MPLSRPLAPDSLLADQVGRVAAGFRALGPARDVPSQEQRTVRHGAELMAPATAEHAQFSKPRLALSRAHQFFSTSPVSTMPSRSLPGLGVPSPPQPAYTPGCPASSPLQPVVTHSVALPAAPLLSAAECQVLGNGPRRQHRSRPPGVAGRAAASRRCQERDSTSPSRRAGGRRAAIQRLGSLTAESSACKQPVTRRGFAA